MTKENCKLAVPRTVPV